MNRPPADELPLIDQELQAWRQGDVAFPQEFIFLHLADLRQPLTAAAKELAAGEPDPGIQGVAREIEGVVVLTQSCDIVRPCERRPFVEVAPLIRVPDGDLERIRKGHHPNLAWVPAVSGNGLVAALDEVMTVEKAVVTRWTRIPGCTTDQEARSFARGLARKCSRPAFPDDFNKATTRFQQRLKDKHGKATFEGRMLEALEEIRVRAAPSWAGASVDVFFWFIKDHDPENLRDQWHHQVETWMRLIDWSRRFELEGFLVCRLDELTGRDYVESELFDLDHLSL